MTRIISPASLRLSLGAALTVAFTAVFTSGLAPDAGAQSNIQTEQSRITGAVQRNPLESPILSEAARNTAAQNDGLAAPPSPGDPDLGEQWLLSEEARYKAFTFSASSGVMRTDNVALTNGGELADTYFLGQVGGSWLPSLRNGFFAQVYGRYEWYRYDKFNILDFDALNTGAGLLWISTKIQGLSAFARYNFDQLYNDGGDDFYTSHGVEVGAMKIFEIARAHQWYIGTSAEWAVDAEPLDSRRHEYRLSLGYQAKFTSWLRTDMALQSLILDYPERDRVDFNQVGVLSFTVAPWEWLSLTASGSYVINRSDESVFDYEAGTVGAILSATLHF